MKDEFPTIKTDRVLLHEITDLDIEKKLRSLKSAWN